MPSKDDIADLLLDALAQRVAEHPDFAQRLARASGGKRKDDPDRPRYVDEFEAAEQLGRSVHTLRAARQKKGPLAKVLAYHRVAGKVRYAQTDLDRLNEGGRVDPAAAE